jgi:adenylate cyclase
LNPPGPPGFFGPNEGWALEPIAGWLLTEGRQVQGLPELVVQLTDRLDAAGATVDRIRLTSTTLHPQVLAWGVFWDRGQGARPWAGEHGVQNLDAYIGSPNQFVRDNKQAYRKRLDVPAADDDHPTLEDLRAEGMVDYYALPVIFSNGDSNVLTLATRLGAGFSDADLARFDILANLLAPLVELISTRRMTLGLLDAFVGPRTSEKILQGQVKRGDGDRIEAAFWYSDLRGFTALNETLPVADLLHLLNEYFEYCAAAAAPRGGEILQFIGDAILIVFEIGNKSKEAEVCESALDAAIDAFNSIAVVNHRRKNAGMPLIEFGLGLHLGMVTHANVGSPARLAFNVVGPAVNTTARIQSMTKELGEPLLLSAAFARHVKRPLRSVGEHSLRGVAGPQALYTPVEI